MVVQHICDLAEIQISPAGTTIRLHMLLIRERLT